MKLSASLLLAVNSAKGAETPPAGCCQHVRIEATNTGLTTLDNSGMVLNVSHLRNMVLTQNF